MPIEQIIVLAIVQGISEFLPISSSAHLIIVPAITQWNDQGLATDVMIHIGSLAAVIVYFRKDVSKMIGGLIKIAKGEKNQYGNLAILIIIATIPAVIIGAMMQLIAPHNPWRNVELIAYNSAIFAIILYITDRFASQTKQINEINMKSAIIIGIAQAIALMPGVSRSGITISAARAIGINRQDAAKFSFLLAIPAITIAGMFTAIQATQNANTMPDGAITTAILSFFTAIIAIWTLMTIIKHISFLVFVIYRLILSLVLFAMIYQWVPDILPTIAN